MDRAAHPLLAGLTPAGAAYRAKSGGRNVVAPPPSDPVGEAERLLSEASG